jgi:hypothetical protein
LVGETKSRGEKGPAAKPKTKNQKTKIKKQNQNKNKNKKARLVREDEAGF